MIGVLLVLLLAGGVSGAMYHAPEPAFVQTFDGR